MGYVEGILRKLSSYPTAGIPGDEGDLRRRIKKFESNIKPLPHLPSVFQSLKQTIMTSKIWWVILGSAILSSLCGGLIYGMAGTVEGISIAIVALIIMFLSTYFDWKKDLQFVKLQALVQEQSVTVIRGKFGATQKVQMWDLVVGDVVLLNAGD